jgi:hypothetical protein
LPWMEILHISASQVARITGLSWDLMFHQPFLCWVFSRQGLANYLPRLALNHDPPDFSQVSRMTDMSHWNELKIQTLDPSTQPLQFSFSWRMAPPASPLEIH